MDKKHIDFRITTIPTTRSIWSDLMRAVGKDVTYLAEKAKNHQLSNVERKSLIEYTQALNRLSEQEDKLAKKDLIANMSPEEKVLLATQILPNLLKEMESIDQPPVEEEPDED